MDPEMGNKRKATTTPGESNNISRGNKAKKPNPPEGTGSVTLNANSEPPRGSDLTQKLVAMWVGGNHGHHPFMSQEVPESMALRDALEKSSEAESVVQMLRNKMKNAETVNNDLNKSLRTEEKIKAELITKMNLTGDLATTIMEHINYITDTLQRCQQHKVHLANLYNAIILKQREDYSWLKNREEKFQERIKDLERTINALETNLEKARHSQQDKSNEMQRAFETELAKVRDECDKTRKQLEEIGKEKKKIQSTLTDKEFCTLQLEKKITEYEDQLTNLKEQLTKASANMESMALVKSQLEKELADKNRQIVEISKDLESATTKRNEQSLELTTIRDKNNELEEKIKCQDYQRQLLAKSLEVASERSEQLTRQVGKLKDEKEEAVREMKSKIENAERESKRILSEAKKETQELGSKQESLLKFHVDKYESCLAEMKLLEARHQSELSRASASSNSALINATTENHRLEEALGTLKREKNDLQVELQQIEDLLKKHTNSEKQLRARLDHCQAEAARCAAAAAATAQAEKKAVEDEKQEKISKIKELERELLKLQFNRNVTTPSRNPDSNVSVNAVRKANKDRVSAKKPPASSTYKKSILKCDSRPRKTRSSPPSPITVDPLAPATTNRKITFNLDSSSDSSPVKLLQSSIINDFMDSSDLFDDLVGTGKSSSQPMQSSQTRNSQSQPGTRKFFKSRASQSK